MEIIYNVVAEENSQCYTDNLKRTTEFIIPLMEDYISKVDFNKYTSSEFGDFLEEFKQSIIFNFGIFHESYGRYQIPNDEVWIIIHNKGDHQCRLEIKINSIFRIDKINKLFK